MLKFLYQQGNMNIINYAPNKWASEYIKKIMIRQK